MTSFQSVGMISQQFDACASWWTQGPDVKMQVSFPFLYIFHNN